MQHIAELVSGDKTHWQSRPGWYETVYNEALAVLWEKFPNASIRLRLAS